MKAYIIGGVIGFIVGFIVCSIYANYKVYEAYRKATGWWL